MMKLFYVPGACSIISHIVLEEAGADFEAVRINFATGDQRKPEFLSINPKGRVPALVTDRGVITEGPAIVAYLAQTFPQADLAPIDDPFAFAEVQAFNVYLATTVHITYRQISCPNVYADGEAAHAALRAKVPSQSDIWFKLVEDKLADGRPFVHGEKFTVSDPYLWAFSSYLQVGDRGDASLFPNIERHRRRIDARPATRRVVEREGLPPEWWLPAVR